MKVGITQLNSNDRVEDNFEQIKLIVENSYVEKPGIIFFPENSLYFRIDPNSEVKPISLDDSILSELEKLSLKNEVALHITTAVRQGNQVFNASLMIEPHRGVQIVYKKMHLFDIELTGLAPIRESDSFVHGESPSVSEFEGFKLGHSICYDLRFAELYSSYAKNLVDIILVPAAFLVKTGLAHWEVLLRARAIESQCYVIASAQSGVHLSVFDNQSRETFGHSMIIDPWGQIVAIKRSGVGIIYADINKSDILKVRSQIPMQAHRRNVF